MTEATTHDGGGGGLMHFSFDNYGGVEIEALPSSSATTPEAFAGDLSRIIETWKAARKRGLWLRVPLAAAATAVGPAVAQGFRFHHALPEYVMLTRWLPGGESPLPRYGFTQIGVGGVVVDGRGRVLMVQERVSPVPRLQGSWKLPGGLADPGEDFCDTVAREVREETGIAAVGDRLSSLRHSHGYRFGQGDVYVVVVMETAEGSSEEITMSDELMGAQWMAPEEIETRVVPSSSTDSLSLDGKVTETNWKVIQQALARDGPTIIGTRVRTSRPTVKPPMLYMAEDSTARAADLAVASHAAKESGEVTGATRPAN